MIDAKSRVTLNFSLTLEDGRLIDSTFERAQPPSFTMGDGSLLPGFEQCLLGLVTGDRKQFVVEPKDAFGARNPLNIQTAKRETFKEEHNLAIGMVISFFDARKFEVPGVITEIGDELVTVDFNHPLAGENVIFDVEIIDVQ